jgi:hypothetical protein
MVGSRLSNRSRNSAVVAPVPLLGGSWSMAGPVIPPR